ncbi:hypothetical protein AHAS_Ahas07G0094100 [Arachis hypogaea]
MLHRRRYQPCTAGSPNLHCTQLPSALLALLPPSHPFPVLLRRSPSVGLARIAPFQTLMCVSLFDLATRPAELAAVGVSTFVFNLVSKIFSIPLLNITTSFVAEEQALINKDSSQTDESNFGGKYQSKRRIPSISTSLALAATLGIVETVLLSLVLASL